MRVKVTQHARQRFAQRTGRHPRESVKEAQHAWDTGLDPAALGGMFLGYIKNIGAENSAYKVRGHFIYVFKGRHLVTIYHLPDHFHDTYNEVMKEKKHA